MQGTGNESTLSWQNKYAGKVNIEYIIPMFYDNLSRLVFV